jgi:hypothetical protein
LAAAWNSPIQPLRLRLSWEIECNRRRLLEIDQLETSRVLQKLIRHAQDQLKRIEERSSQVQLLRSWEAAGRVSIWTQRSSFHSSNTSAPLFALIRRAITIAWASSSQAIL